MQQLRDLHDRPEVDGLGGVAGTAASVAGHRRDVATGTEPTARTGEHDRAHAVVVRQRAQLVAQREHVLEVEGVEFSGRSSVTVTTAPA